MRCYLPYAFPKLITTSIANQTCGILANACGVLNTTKLGPMEGVFKRKKVNEFIKINS